MSLKTAPIVSVLMTAHNREPYIAQAIESVLASSLEDFELIVVDDGSTDDTVAIARRYNGDARVQVHINEKNLGDYPNRNQAAALAQGKYIKYLDSDDIIYAHGLEVMVAAMENFPDAALGIECAPSIEKPYPVQIPPKQAYHEHFFQGRTLFGGPTATILNSKAFRALNGFSGKRYVGDTEMWLRLAAQYPVVQLMTGLTWRRQHAGQEEDLGHKTFTYEEWNYKIALLSLIDEKCPFDDNEKDKMIRRFKQGHGRILLCQAFLQRQPLTALKRMKKEGFSFKDLPLAFLPGRIS